MEQDQLSNLPNTILHDILSRLPEEDAVRTSVLSKSWAETWSTFPILSFCDTKIKDTLVEDYLRRRNKFLDNVERTLLRFHNHSLTIKQFKLILNCFDLYYLSMDVDLWLKLASESGVEVLHLFQSHDGCEHSYILPIGVLETKSLTKVVLNGKITVDLRSMNHSIKFFLLQVLSLENVFLEDEHAFNHFISCCPLIEYITLKWCYVLNRPSGEGHLLESLTRGIKSLSMYDLPRLKRVVVQGIQKVYVDSPCLEKLCYCPGSQLEPFKIDFNRCRNLRRLTLMFLISPKITNKWFVELFAKFPFLESLKLRTCIMSAGINISSVQLKVLKLSMCPCLKNVNIDAPNLLSCVYEADSLPVESISFLRCSSQLKVNVSIHILFGDFYFFRKFIQNFKPKTILASVSLNICQSNGDALNPIVLQVSSPPLPIIKHLDLRSIPKYEALYLPLVYKLLSSCCPTTVSMSLYSSDCRAFIEFFYETLMGKNKDKCFCNSGDTRCWWHHLKGVKVTSSRNTDENVDFKTMLDTLPTTSSTKENISFRSEF